MNFALVFAMAIRLQNFYSHTHTGGRVMSHTHESRYREHVLRFIDRLEEEREEREYGVEPTRLVLFSKPLGDRIETWR